MALTSSWKLLNKVMREYVLPHYKVLGLGLTSMVMTAITTAILATYLKPIFDDIFIGHHRELLHYIALGVLGIFFLKGLSEYGGFLCMEYVGQKLTLAFQQKLFEHLIFLDFSFFRQHHGASLISLLTNDIRVLRHCILQSLSNIAKEGVTVVSLIIVMVRENIVLSATALIGLPLALIPLIYCGRKVRTLSLVLQSETASLQTFFHQTFQNISLIKAMHTEYTEVASLKHRLKGVFQKSLRTFRTRAIVHPVMEILGGLAIVIVILNGGIQVIKGRQTTGSFLTFITALLFIYRPLKNIVSMNTQLQEGLAAAERIFHVFDTHETLERESRCFTTRPAEDEQLFQGDIQFQDITFGYEDNLVPLYRHFSCHFPAGKKIALVGPSGGGKSTLFYLLLRFYRPQEGQITWGGKDISTLNLQDLRRHISFVSQDISLFDDTVLNNICYGCPEATLEEVQRAAKAAYADAFIADLPLGYDTRIGENGLRLSGGQRQRIALARAFLRDAPLLLLDEATSALDNVAAQQISQAVDRLTHRRTTVMIAHRLSTIATADYVFFIHQGQIIEHGPYQQLLQANGAFTHLASLLQDRKP